MARRSTTAQKVDYSKIEAYFLSGASIHQVCNKFKISLIEATGIQERVAEETKQEIINHKILVRSQIRKSVPFAVELLNNVLNPQLKTEKGRQIAEDLETTNGRAKLGLKLKAAQMILQSGKDALNDSLLTMLSEKPNEEPLEQTLFDYQSEIDEKGGMRLVVTPREIDG